MEFYARIGEKVRTQIERFNSQRDGILLSQKTPLKTAQRFNSQRDGILLFVPKPARISPNLFQFPTGWNSTVLRVDRLHLIMESFNSQRDGILPYEFLCVF